jgi:hypothetical protein
VTTCSVAAAVAAIAVAAAVVAVRLELPLLGSVGGVAAPTWSAVFAFELLAAAAGVDVVVFVEAEGGVVLWLDGAPVAVVAGCFAAFVVVAPPLGRELECAESPDELVDGFGVSV